VDPNQLDRIADKIEEIRADIAEIKVDLRYHIKRTDLLDDDLKQQRKELKPVVKHVEQMQGALNLVKVLGVILSVVLAVAAVVALV
jgi:uncharacterized protein YoxC